MTRAWLALALCGAACRPAPPARPLAISRAPLPAAGDVIAAVEQRGALYLVAPDRVTIERGGAAAVSVLPPSGAWAEAVATPALDAADAAPAGDWVVARTTEGGLWRITATGDLEPIADRLGVPPRARSIGAGGGTFAIALDDAIAVTRDRAHIARFPLDPAPGPISVSAARDRIAVRRGGRIAVWDLAHDRHVDYMVADALAVGFATATGPAPLVVATGSAVWLEHADGLHRLAAPAALRGVAIAGSRVWVATAAGVFVVEGDRFVRTAADAAAAQHLVGLAGGDVVAIAAPGVARLSIDRGDDDPRWRAEIKPIIDRVCLRCHRPGGSAGLDLSSVTAWRAEHAELVHRVVETQTMPPAGTELSPADRRALARWLGP